jgi:hypothetical protein
VGVQCLCLKLQNMRVAVQSTQLVGHLNLWVPPDLWSQKVLSGSEASQAWTTVGGCSKCGACSLWEARPPFLSVSPSLELPSSKAKTGLAWAQG